MILDIILCYLAAALIAWILIPRLRALKRKFKEKPRVSKQKP